MNQVLDSVSRLTRDIKNAALVLSTQEVRFLVDAYYTMQEDRKRGHNRVRALAESEEPNSVISWLAEQSRVLEQQILRALAAYADGQPVGMWAQSIVGVGPVITAGLLAHIDITQAPTVGHIWRFAGLDPTSKWNKGERRPWNASLKVLCWKIGESFVKVKNHDDDFYGKIYDSRKEYESQRNAAGVYAEQAAAVIAACPTHKQAAIYKEGKLSPGHIHARAKRYAVKLFLAHYHERAYALHYGVKPPLPYPLAHLGHVHKIEPPK